MLQKLARLSKDTLGSGLGRTSGQGRGTGHSSKGSRRDVMELIERTSMGAGSSNGGGGSAGEGITVSYDVWRRSEEAPPVPPKDGKVVL